jgi:hypothetical protein
MKRWTRKKMFKLAKRGEVALRVLGTEKTGFQLGVESESGVVTFGHQFAKQKLAVIHGEKQVGQTAKKLLRKAA